MAIDTGSDDAPEQPLPREGDLLVQGRYRVERVLGQGGMGAVFAAADVLRGERVAIKILLPHLAEDPDIGTRFLREARAIAALKSEHVARFHDVVRDEGGRLHLIMELLAGRDLLRVCKDQGNLPIAEAVGYVLQACDAIAEAHSLGIVHRDLKPQNLFLAERPGAPPVLKVLDFGLAKVMVGELSGKTGPQGLTQTGALMGSPPYMPPEQLRSSKRVDVRSDIWALGMILHRLLTGQIAFDVSSIGELLATIAVEPPIPLRARLPGAPAQLEEAILRCLQREPARRFQNVGQLALALAPFSPAAASAVLPRITALLGEKAIRAPLPPMELPDRAPASSAKQDTSLQDASTVPVGKQESAPDARRAGCLGVLAAVAAIALSAAAAAWLFT
jgi:serine/threonine-protein kinase